jgi:hypothetical protein
MGGKMKRVFVLMEDQDGTMSSQPQPIGQSVTTEEEAKEWVAKESWKGQRSYYPVNVY